MNLTQAGGVGGCPTGPSGIGHAESPGLGVAVFVAFVPGRRCFATRVAVAALRA
jgi:hypothetical protein